MSVQPATADFAHGSHVITILIKHFQSGCKKAMIEMSKLFHFEMNIFSSVSRKISLKNEKERSHGRALLKGTPELGVNFGGW